MVCMKIFEHMFDILVVFWIPLAQWLNWITEEMTEAYEDKLKKKSILKIFDLSFEEGYCKKLIRKKHHVMNWTFSNNNFSLVL